MIPSDSNGNTLICIPNGNYITVKLKLSKPNVDPARNYPRKLGVIDCQARVMTCYRNRELHLHLKKYAYGFCYDLINKATRFDSVLIDEKFGKERHKYLIPRQVILDLGETETYGQQGYEQQIFLSFYTVKTFEQ